MAYKCPICGRKYKTFYALKQHFRKSHDLKVCPSCGRKVEKSFPLHCVSVMKSKKVSEKVRKEHEILYLLSKNPRAFKNRAKLYQKLRDDAIEYLWEDDD